MTYGLFLLIFLGMPLAALAFQNVRDLRQGRQLPGLLTNLPAGPVIWLHVLIAVLYTTPWDNYLVATGVWAYDPALVTGITLGWVPIEEYTFFVLQTLATGLLLLFLARRIQLVAAIPTGGLRVRMLATLALGLVWLAGGVLPLAAGWTPGRYLGLILVWALPPVMLQMAFGADLLWRFRRLVLTAVLAPTLYLSAADSLAIGAGTWMISPKFSTGILLGGLLPVEEFLFFLMTNVLIVFGATLALSCESRTRARRWLAHLRLRAGGECSPDNNLEKAL